LDSLFFTTALVSILVKFQPISTFVENGIYPRHSLWPAQGVVVRLFTEFWIIPNNSIPLLLILLAALQFFFLSQASWDNLFLEF
jgi:hypothetical protein